MATIKIMYWRDIPYALRTFDQDTKCSKQLPALFETSIDKAAMVSGLTDQDSYHSQFHWGKEETRPGTAEEVALEVHDELVAAYTPSRLEAMTRE